MTPTLECNHLCLHCWRPIDISLPCIQPVEPRPLLDGILEEHRRLLSGYGGSRTTDMRRLEESRDPRHVAVSLIGEPTLYPYLSDLLAEIARRGMTSFLVTNGTNPDVLEGLSPTQLYLSLNAPDEEVYRRVSRPSGDLWPRILESLSIMGQKACRRVVRLTLVRGLNMARPAEYAPLLEEASPDFVEVKAYMHLGRSRMRLGREAMPEHSEVLDFARSLGHALGYELSADVPISRVALLSSGRVTRGLGPEPGPA